jgi:hypothetical protein
MTDTLLNTDELPKFSGLLQNIFPDGTIEYDGVIGQPMDFPLTEAEQAEVLNPGELTTSPPSQNYYTFWDGLLTSSIYASIREQAMQSLPMNTLATEFVALLGDAKLGRPLQPAIQDSITAILSTGTFTQPQIAELQLILQLSGLSAVYTLFP